MDDYLVNVYMLTEDTLLKLLRRVASGESPDMVLAEVWANGDHIGNDE